MKPVSLLMSPIFTSSVKIQERKIHTYHVKQEYLLKTGDPLRFTL